MEDLDEDINDESDPDEESLLILGPKPASKDI
jgi:hypothetical protein